MANELAEQEAPPAQYESSPMSVIKGEHDEIAELIWRAFREPLSRAAFGEALCLILEDISGFENPDPDTLQDLIGVAWEQYRSAIPDSKDFVSA